MARDFYNDIDMQGQRVINLSDPANPQDSATKAYVDSVGGGGGSLVITNTVVNYTALITDDIIITTADITLYAGAGQTKLISIRNIGNSRVLIIPNGVETIENKTNAELRKGNSYTLAYDGTSNWYIV